MATITHATIESIKKDAKSWLKSTIKKNMIKSKKATRNLVNAFNADIGSTGDFIFISVHPIKKAKIMPPSNGPPYRAAI